MTETIVTHQSPDWDAIGSTWLIKRFLLPDAEIAFVNTGSPDQALLSSASAVVDTGKIHDPDALRFDHHQLTGDAANATCATTQVFSHIVLYTNTESIVHLKPLIDLICHGDTGKSEANLSRSVGIHALLSVRKARRMSDDALMAWGFEVLDDLAEHLKRQSDAKRSLAHHMVYRSPDGLVVALENAPQGATFAAFEEGAQLVVWCNTTEPETTISVGMNRAPESGVHCGELVLAAAQQASSGTLAAELTRWYRHPAGFFAGRGTAKAPDTTPLTISIGEIASALYFAWKH